MKPEQIRSIRERLELTQAALAEALGVDRVTVARWEAGALPIDRRTEMAIEHLECPKNKKGKS